MSSCCPYPLMGVIQVGLWVPTPSPWAWYNSICRLLTLPQVDLPALAFSSWIVPRYPTASLNQCDCWAAARHFTYFLCVYVCVCVCVCERENKDPDWWTRHHMCCNIRISTHAPQIFYICCNYILALLQQGFCSAVRHWFSV